MGFFGNTKGSIISSYFKLLEDTGKLRANNMCDMALYEDHLELKVPFVKQEVKLKYNKINDVFHGLKTDLVEANKSVLGRALVGGVLLGGVGALVGAVSGTGKKVKRDTKLYLIIGYTNSSGKKMFLQFEDTQRTYKGKQLVDELRFLCGLDAPEDEETVEL
jgi:hypothetical protein